MSWASALPTIPPALPPGSVFRVVWKRCAGSGVGGRGCYEGRGQGFLQGQQPRVPFETAAMPDPAA